MASKPSILSVFKKGQSLGAIEHFDDTMNWLIGFIDNLKGDYGVKLKNAKTDHPTIEANLIAGNKIKITETESGALKISVKSEDDDDDEDDDTTTSKRKKKSGGGGGGGGGEGGGGGGAGAGSGGAGAGGGGSGTGGAGGGGGGGAGGGGGTDCNQFSEDLDNDNRDSGMENGGDVCAELNGW